jgi:hypothetical protein
LFGGGEFAAELGGEFRLQLVFGDADGVGFGFQGELDFHVVFLGAEDDADGRTVVRGAFLFVQEIQLEIHFAGELGFEGDHFYPVR